PTAQRVGVPEFAVVREAEAVGLVADAHEEEERRVALVEADRQLAPRHEDALLLRELGLRRVRAARRSRAGLGEAADRDLPRQPEAPQRLEGARELPLAAVDNDQVGERLAVLEHPRVAS